MPMPLLVKRRNNGSFLQLMDFYCRHIMVPWAQRALMKVNDLCLDTFPACLLVEIHLSLFPILYTFFYNMK